jgi:phage protein D
VRKEARKNLQAQHDAIDKLSESDVRFVAKKAYTDLYGFTETWKKSEKEWKKKCKKLSVQLEKTQISFYDYKNRLRKLFEL